MITKKTEFANLENKKTIFLETGMIIALVLVLYTFNYKSYDKLGPWNYQRMADNTPVDLAPVS